VQAFLRTNVWRTFRYNLVRLTAQRSPTTCTCFVRVRTQFEVLADVVVPRLMPSSSGRPLEIVVLACSTGAEPYSIASYLTLRWPGLRFHVRAADINGDLIAQARRGRYHAQEVLDCWAVDRDFVTHTFQREGDTFVVKPHIARHVSFEVADLLDRDLPRQFAPADIVYAQNVLFHFRPRTATRAFRQLCALLRQPGALFVDGMDIPLRTRLTRKHKLQPLDYRVREIHEDARVLRARFWPWYYWGLEDYGAHRPDATARYATIFLR
jgi:chemotaxis methyl-accepting protein methylase